MLGAEPTKALLALWGILLPHCRAVPGGGWNQTQRWFVLPSREVSSLWEQRCPWPDPFTGLQPRRQGGCGLGRARRLSAVCLQEEYIREQIDWREITFADNQPCINLISLKPYGILRILDDQCCFPQVSHGCCVSLVRLVNVSEPYGLIRSRSCLLICSGLGDRSSGHPTYNSQPG